MSDRYEQVLRELREALEGQVIGSQHIGPAMIISTQEYLRSIIARRYDVPLDWVNLTDVRLSDDRRNMICDGFTITPGGLDYIL